MATTATPISCTWRVVPGFPGYEASTQGQLRCKKKNKIMKVSPNGVYMKSLSGKQTRHMLHVWIALTFVPNPHPVRFSYVRYKDESSGACADNLYWGTHPLSKTVTQPLPPCPRPASLSHTDKYAEVLQKYRSQQTQVWTRLSSKHGTMQEGGCMEAKTIYHNVKMGIFNIRIYKLAYLLFNHDVDLARISEESLVIRHKCGNARCFEPSHLELGTPTQNLYDDKARDGTMICGIKDGRCTITEAVAKAIMASKKGRGVEGYMTRKARAEYFKVSEKLIQHIDSGHSWAHLQNRSPSEKAAARVKATQKARRARVKVWTPDMFKVAAARIKAKIDVVECKDPTVPGCCHEWKGNPSGYGYFITPNAHNVSPKTNADARYW
jgi:hypothetical protein